MKTERDKRSAACFTLGYGLEQEGRTDEAIKAFEASIEYIDTEMRSTSAFTRLYSLYKEKGDKENMRRILEEGIRYAIYFNEKAASGLIKKYPEHKEGILEALETNKPHGVRVMDIRANYNDDQRQVVFVLGGCIYNE